MQEKQQVESESPQGALGLNDKSEDMMSHWLITAVKSFQAHQKASRSINLTKIES